MRHMLYVYYQESRQESWWDDLKLLEAKVSSTYPTYCSLMTKFQSSLRRLNGKGTDDCRSTSTTLDHILPPEFFTFDWRLEVLNPFDERPSQWKTLSFLKGSVCLFKLFLFLLTHKSPDWVIFPQLTSAVGGLCPLHFPPHLYMLLDLYLNWTNASGLSLYASCMFYDSN